MATTAGINWSSSPGDMAGRVEAYGKRLLAAVYALASEWARRLADEAKQTHPWTNRTGEAEAKLFGRAVRLATGALIVLGHGAAHGIGPGTGALLSVTDDLRAILAADATFAGLMPGGVLGEPLTATGPMWVADPVTGIKTLQPTAVLLEPQEVAAPFGLNPDRRLDIWQEPELFFYADHDDMSLFDVADTRAMVLLHGQRIGLADVTATPYRARPLVADELPGDIWHIFRRFRVVTVRHIQEV